MLRLFAGIPLPSAVRESLGALQTGIPGARWVAPESLHLTLVFIGEVDEGAAEDIDEALAAIRGPAFDLRLSEVGHFGNRKSARAIWAGVVRAEPLTRLQEKVEVALNHAGIDVERRKYKPHVTLARLRNAPVAKVGDFLEAHNTFAAGPFAVDRFVLFRSRLGSGGAVYEILADYPLDGPAAD